MKNIKRYILAALCGAGLVFMLGVGIDAMKVDADPLASVRRNFSNETKNSELNSLIAKYYDAYDTNDIDSLQEAAHPFSDSELSYVKLMSDNIESREIKEIYSKNGADKGSYLVSVVNDITFSGMKKAAPGLDFFYVETDPSNNKLFINNLYSTYNLNNAENPVDADVTALISEFEQQTDVMKLQAKVQNEFNEAMASDSELKDYFDNTLQAKVSEWAQAYHQGVLDQKAQEDAAAKEAAEQKAKEDAAAKEEADKKAAEEKAAKEEEARKAEEAAKAAQIPSGEAVINAVTVNVRSAADTNSENIGRLDAGTRVRKIRTEGEWTVIGFKDREGFVKSEYFTTISGTDARDITLTGTVNVRAEMSENGQKVAVAQMGTAVKVVEDYSNGWSKVTVGASATGFSKTEYLK